MERTFVGVTNMMGSPWNTLGSFLTLLSLAVILEHHLTYLSLWGVPSCIYSEGLLQE